MSFYSNRCCKPKGICILTKRGERGLVGSMGATGATGQTGVIGSFPPQNVASYRLDSDFTDESVGPDGGTIDSVRFQNPIVINNNFNTSTGEFTITSANLGIYQLDVNITITMDGVSAQSGAFITTHIIIDPIPVSDPDLITGDQVINPSLTTQTMTLDQTVNAIVEILQPSVIRIQVTILPDVTLDAGARIENGLFSAIRIQ